MNYIINITWSINFMNLLVRNISNLIIDNVNKDLPIIQLTYEEFIKLPIVKIDNDSYLINNFTYFSDFEYNEMNSLIHYYDYLKCLTIHNQQIYKINSIYNDYVEFFKTANTPLNHHKYNICKNELFGNLIYNKLGMYLNENK